MYNFNFYEHPESCGEEGLRGPTTGDDALRHMYDAVCRDEVLAGIFIVERGYRKGRQGRVGAPVLQVIGFFGIII